MIRPTLATTLLPLLLIISAAAANDPAPIATSSPAETDLAPAIGDLPPVATEPPAEADSDAAPIAAEPTAEAETDSAPPPLDPLPLATQPAAPSPPAASPPALPPIDAPLADPPCGAIDPPLLTDRDEYPLPHNYRLALYREYMQIDGPTEHYQRFEILRHGQSLVCYPPHDEGGAYRLWPHFLREGGLGGTLAQDVTGDGTPDLVVEEYTGGAHCCTTFHIVELAADRLVELPPLETGHGGGQFLQADDDDALEFKMNDWSYAYYFTCFAMSPAPQVTLDLTFTPEGHYAWQFANPRMELSSAAIETLRDAAARMRREAARMSAEGEDPRHSDAWAEVLRHYLDLIYFGQSRYAARFLREALEGRDADRIAFIVDMALLLRENAYCERILELNGCTTLGELLSGGGR